MKQEITVPILRNTRRRAGRLARVGAGTAGLLLPALLIIGCMPPRNVDLQRRVEQLERTVAQQENDLAARDNTITALNEKLARARGLTAADLEHIFYPEKIAIDRLSGGADYDGKPGDDGVTVYIRPVDRDGDVVKVAGDVRIQLFDLSAPADRNLIGEYFVSADEISKLWHGKLMTDHYTIKCPWPGTPPTNREITIRVTFTDYFTQRILSAQTTCQVTLPPSR